MNPEELLADAFEQIGIKARITAVGHGPEPDLILEQADTSTSGDIWD